jgi:hypothetical protein
MRSRLMASRFELVGEKRPRRGKAGVNVTGKAGERRAQQSADAVEHAGHRVKQSMIAPVPPLNPSPDLVWMGTPDAVSPPATAPQSELWGIK